MKDVPTGLVAIALAVAAAVSVYLGYWGKKKRNLRPDWVVCFFSIPWGGQALVYAGLALSVDWLECRPDVWFGILEGLTFTLALLLTMHLINGRVNLVMDQLLLLVTKA